MSKASDVRDAVATELTNQLPGQAVDRFVLPKYTRDELENPRVVVRNGGRNLTIGQGVDTTEVLIEIGVVANVSMTTTAATKAEELQNSDDADALLETVIALWGSTDDGDGPLRNCGMANHSFEDMEQTLQFDPERLYNDGVWLSLVTLTYQDSED